MKQNKKRFHGLCSKQFSLEANYIKSYKKAVNKQK